MPIIDVRLKTLTRLDLGINFLGLLTLSILAFGSHSPPIYDEPHRLETARLLQEAGLTPTFLREMPHAPGPLTPIIQVVLAPLTHLSPPGIRITNIAFLLVTLSVEYFSLRRECFHNSFAASLGMLALPATWVVAGLALTEMPAIACITLFLYFVRFSSSNPFGWQHVACSIAAGGFLSLSILGRQPYLLVILPLLGFGLFAGRKQMLSSSITSICALPAPLLVFSIWQGLTPPLAAAVGNGFSITNGIFAYGYAGIFTLLLAPRWLFCPSLMAGMSTFGVCIVFNSFWRVLAIAPLASVARHLLPTDSLPIYELVCGASMLCIAIWFVFSLALYCWTNHINTYAAFLGIAVLLILATSFKITANFSSRYVAMCFPMLIIMTRDHRHDTTLPFRSLFGNILGAAALLSYLAPE